MLWNWIKIFLILNTCPTYTTAQLLKVNWLNCHSKLIFLSQLMFLKKKDVKKIRWFLMSQFIITLKFQLWRYQQFCWWGLFGLFRTQDHTKAVFFNLGSVKILILALLCVSRFRQSLNNVSKVPRLKKGWKALH